MKNLAELRQSMTDVIVQARTIMNKAKDEGRSLTDEENSQVEALHNQAEALDTEIQLEERQLQLERGIGLNPNEPIKEEPDKNPEQRFGSFGEMLMAVYRASRPNPEIDPRLSTRAATGLSEGVATDGGFLIQPDFSSELLKRAYDTGVLASRCTRVPISSVTNALKFNSIDETSRVNGSRWGGIQAFWEGEAAELTGSKPKFKVVDLSLKKLTGLCYATDELLQDSVALEAIVSQGFSEEFGFQIDDVILNGTGEGQPLGIVPSAALVSEQTKALDKLYKVTQLTGVSSQQLMEQLVFFGAPLRSMGINFGEAAALVGKFEKEGVNAELVLTSMRRAAVNMTKAGVTDIAGGFAGAVQQIKNAKSDAEAMKTAIDIFGARSANDMMRAIRENRFELGELFNALNSNSDSLTLAAAETATAGVQFEKLKHQIQNAIEPLGISFVEAVKASMPMIEAGAKKLKELIDSFTALPDATKKSIAGIALFAAIIGPTLTGLGYMVIGLGALPGVLARVQAAVSAAISFVKSAAIAFQMWQAGVYTFGEAALAVMGPGGWIALGIGVVIALTQTARHRTR